MTNDAGRTESDALMTQKREDYCANVANAAAAVTAAAAAASTHGLL